MSAAAEILEVREVHKSFGRLRAIDGVTFSLAEKKITILIGPNGSGKTTLVNVISGFYKPDSGDILYRSQKITGWAPHRIYRTGIARTFQVPALFWKLNVLENLLVAEKQNEGENFLRAPFRGLWKKDEEASTVKAARILELLNLSQHWKKQASTLSGGQMKLLEMGRALMSGAELLLLDEPISGVNPTLAHEIFATIVRLRDELGVTFLIVEHRLDIALGYVDQVLAMAYGKIVSSGTPQAVISDPQVIESYLGA
ncbi:MAG: ABC transporter ATP-binding protein [Thaumarchaeota archaeon]|nr:ABC transporter ATP-binding protein [Nitrososphaerota archaeon]